MNNILNSIQNGLVVSCQAEGDSPFNTTEGISLLAISAYQGGAVGLRIEGISNIIKIKEKIDLPVIGLIKDKFPDGFVKITRSFEDVEKLISIGCEIIAIDGTNRKFNGLAGHEFIKRCKDEFKDICIMADISNTEDARLCFESGADCISTTLRGYTPDTLNIGNHFDFKFFKELLNRFDKSPIIAEGRINTPEIAAKISKMGAWSIVVGTSITRPATITKWFVNSIKNNS